MRDRRKTARRLGLAAGVEKLAHLRNAEEKPNVAELHVVASLYGKHVARRLNHVGETLCVLLLLGIGLPVCLFAAIEDLFSRRIVGWSTASRFDTNLVSTALGNALQSRSIRPGVALELIHHSDQGSQYTSHDYLALLKRFGLTSSMSGRGNAYDNAYDNAPIESFFATLKKEWTHGRIYPTHATLDADLFEFIELYYNRKRLHSALDYRSPLGFEDAFAAQSTNHLPSKENPQSTSFREAVAFCPL